MGEIIDIRELMAGIEVEDVTKKEFLKRYKPIMGRIEAKMEQIERMENSLFPGAQILSGMPGGGQAGDGMIARKMNYSEDNIFKLHAAALKKLRIKKWRAA